MIILHVSLQNILECYNYPIIALVSVNKADATMGWLKHVLYIVSVCFQLCQEHLNPFPTTMCLTSSLEK